MGALCGSKSEKVEIRALLDDAQSAGRKISEADSYAVMHWSDGSLLALRAAASDAVTASKVGSSF